MSDIDTEVTLVEPFNGFNEIKADIRRDIPAHTQVLFTRWGQNASGMEHVVPRGSEVTNALSEKFAKTLSGATIELTQGFKSADQARNLVTHLEEKVLYADRSRMPDVFPAYLDFSRIPPQEKMAKVNAILNLAGVSKNGQIDTPRFILWAGTRHLELVLAEIDANSQDNPQATATSHDKRLAFVEMVKFLKASGRLDLKLGWEDAGLKMAGLTASHAANGVEEGQSRNLLLQVANLANESASTITSQI